MTSWTLKNGLTVHVVEHHQRPLVRLRLVFPSGSSSDDSSRAGATGFAVALLGLGRDVHTPSGELDFVEKPLRRALVERGAYFRSGVDLDGAFVGIDGLSREARPLLETLADAVKRPRQSEAAFAGLLEAASDMVDERQLTDPEVLQRAVLQRAFGDEEAGVPFGTAESLARLSLEPVLRRQEALLHPAGATLLVLGDVRAAEVRALITTAFSSWSGVEDAPVKASPVSARPAPRAGVTFLPRPGARATLVCAARPLGDLKASDAAVEVLAEVLGRRLTARLREREALTYQVATSLEYRLENRALVVCTRFQSQATLVGLRQLFSVLDKAPPLGVEELEVARRQVVARTERQLASLDGLTALWLGHRVRGRAFQPKEALAGLGRVTLPEVAASWAAVTSQATFQLVLLGDLAHVAPAAKALKLGALKTPTLEKVEPAAEPVAEPGADE